MHESANCGIFSGEQKMKNIIVAGANGFLGKTLIKRLIKEDVHIWAISRTFNDKIFSNLDKVTKVNNERAWTVLSETQSYDLFYNFAWQGVNGSEKAEYNVQINNIKLTLHYAELAYSLHCKKYLCAGTIAERAIDSLSFLKTTTGGMMYGVAKACTHLFLEAYCKNIGLNFIWMQFANIYGPENKTGNLVSYTIEQLQKCKNAAFGPALQPYDFLYIDDLIEAVYRLGITETKKNFYYIGSGQPSILKEYLLEIGSIMGKTELIKIGERADDGIVYTEDMFDIDDLVDEIGNYNKTSFTEGMKATLNGRKFSRN